jgi:hypothetical protein
MEAREGHNNYIITCGNIHIRSAVLKVSDLSKPAIFISFFSKQCQIAVHEKCQPDVAHIFQEVQAAGA